MSFSRGEVVLLPVPFTDLTSRKVRPAVVIGLGSHTGDLFVVGALSPKDRSALEQKLRAWLQL
jgi:hypothetical protein